MSTAMIAPTWITAVNAVTASESMSLPRIFSAIVRWAVDDTGRNSVSPSTIPRMIASRMLTWRSACARHPIRSRDRHLGGSHLPLIGHHWYDVHWHGRLQPVSSASDDTRPFFSVADEVV